MTNQNMNEFYAKFSERNTLGYVTPEEQEKLRKSSVAIFGVGGFGGIIAEVMARSGVGKISIVDFDVFDTSNQNRQIFAFCSTRGKRKIDVTADFLKDINPGLVVEKFDKITPDSMAAMLDGANVMVHAVDQAAARLIVSRAAQKRNVPQVEGWAVPYANVIVYNENTPTWEQAYGLQTAGISDEEIGRWSIEQNRALVGRCLMSLSNCEGIMRFVSQEKLEPMVKAHRYTSFAPIVWFESTLMANEALKVLLGWGDLALAPKWAVYDFYRHLIPQRLDR